MVSADQLIETMRKKTFFAALPLALAALLLTACGTTGDYGAPRVVDTGKNVQCVPFARDESGVDLYGDAHTWWNKASGRYEREHQPEEGAVMVLYGYKRTDRGHVAVVKHVTNDREIIVDHANWLNDGKIYLNQPVRDVSAENDWSQVRVWYAPGEQYGARTYDVQGFILPDGNPGHRYASAKEYGF